jgi:hypothetical protein
MAVAACGLAVVLSIAVGVFLRLSRICSECLELAEFCTCKKLGEWLGKLRIVSNNSLHLRVVCSIAAVLGV